MIDLKKSFLIFSSLLVAILGVGSHATAASENTVTDEITPEEAELAEIVSEHIILNNETLANQAKNNDDDVSTQSTCS